MDEDEWFNSNNENDSWVRKARRNLLIGREGKQIENCFAAASMERRFHLPSWYLEIYENVNESFALVSRRGTLFADGKSSTTDSRRRDACEWEKLRWCLLRDECEDDWVRTSNFSNGFNRIAIRKAFCCVAKVTRKFSRPKWKVLRRFYGRIFTLKL